MQSESIIYLFVSISLLFTLIFFSKRAKTNNQIYLFVFITLLIDIQHFSIFMGGTLYFEAISSNVYPNSTRWLAGVIMILQMCIWPKKA